MFISLCTGASLITICLLSHEHLHFIHSFNRGCSCSPWHFYREECCSFASECGASAVNTSVSSSFHLISCTNNFICWCCYLTMGNLPLGKCLYSVLMQDGPARLFSTPQHPCEGLFKRPRTEEGKSDIFHFL